MREPSNDLERQIEAAFDYRGDVTVERADGKLVEGFLFNRDFAPHAALKTTPFVEMMLPSGEQTRYPIAELSAVRLSGQDHAATE